jgi:Zn-dependent protease/predicted transcriptional regulator
MFGKGLKLFKLFGFEVKIDVSWIIIALLVTLTLARGFFPTTYAGLSQSQYLLMGIAGALGLFMSIIFHEFFHSLIARRYGLPMKGITLFVFGGIAEMEDQPQSAKVEFLMALAGPVSSIFLGAFFYSVFRFVGNQLPVPVAAVVLYLGYINLLLAAFNLIPAFPLDGGRVLRSALWHFKGDIRWATRIASTLGSGFGLFLIFTGILSAFGGDFIGGIWLFFIGMFIRGASSMSYRQVEMRTLLEGETVRRFMKEDAVAVPPQVTLNEFLENYFYRYHFKMFPVADNGNLSGCINIEQVKNVPSNERSTRTVREFARECTPENTTSPTTGAMKALTQMGRTGNDKLMVVEKGRLAGILTRNDILRFFSAKMEMEEG